MKTTFSILSLIFLLTASTQFIYAQDYTLTREDNLSGTTGEWQGSYLGGGSYNGGTNVNAISIGRTDAGGSPLLGSSTVVGDYDNPAGLCSGIYPPAGDNASPIDINIGNWPYAFLPDGKTLMITNNWNLPVPHIDENLYITYWDSGDGLFSADGYPATCRAMAASLADTILLPGQSIVLLKEGLVIRPVEMDCLGDFGGPAVIGSPCDDGNIYTEDDAYDENCICIGPTLVPTMSQWGVIILGLSLAIIGLLVFSFRNKLMPEKE
jgi:hypothetical protein